jgi:YD repeat-containing protein
VVTDVFGQAVRYTYDADSNRTQLSLKGGTSVTYQYDAINRLTQLTDATSLNTTFAYDVTDKLTSRPLPNGVVTTSQYDGLDRLTRLTHAKGPNTLEDFQYQFNAINNITQMTDGAGSHNYTYDSLDRLTAATHPSQSNESYTYDVGNRTASHQGSSYSYQAFLSAALMIVLFVTACDQPMKYTEPSRSNNWRRVDLGALTVNLPDDMRERKVKGTDLSLWEFGNESMILEIQYGRTATSGSNFAGQPEYQEKESEIDGLKVIRYTFRLNGSVPTNYSEKGFGFVSAAFFPDLHYFGNKLILLVNYKDQSCQERADEIFKTVKVTTERL